MDENITPLNQQGQPHGYTEYYYSDGDISTKCHHVNNKVVGYLEDHWVYKIKKIYYLI